MWVREYQGTSTANADRLYAILADTTGWQEWNPGVTRIDMEGPFAAGTAATMVLPDGGTLQFRLIWAEPGRGFEDETDVPDAGVRVRVRHELTPLDDGSTQITYRCAVDGPDQVGAEVGPAVSADFPDVIAALAARAEA